ncbi:isopentenyl-diphosphate Delta-isomerase [Oleiphilus sp. HI0067]|uniref:isopentenyl-diphosphate Delta-isomerase n=2 Tax=Oleiphilus sp. HI0067 TaxID=1822243 RepID=UPI0008389AB3|nr:isopentenyl-diphosphate Delta-isomerase [Oleiphilus sp. HI0067]
MVTNELVLVDEMGKKLGLADKLEAHQKGLLHLAFSLVVYRVVDGQREYLLQKRAATKYHGANLWSNTCCSHPFDEELPAAAVQRRVGEELGITQKLDLKELEPVLYRTEMQNGLIEHEYDHVFVSNDTIFDFELNPQEVSETAWVLESDLKTDLVKNPGKYTPWLPFVLGRIPS